MTRMPIVAHTINVVVPNWILDLARQQRLCFLPLPHGQGSLRPAVFGRGLSGVAPVENPEST